LLVYLDIRNNNMGFLKKLKENHWTEIAYNWEYRKGDWVVRRDSSSWWIVGTGTNPRIFDVPEPSGITAVWTVNLIEHLCKMDEKSHLIQELQV
jgi:hypothetical protein